jgi:hypothetical protein
MLSSNAKSNILAGSIGTVFLVAVVYFVSWYAKRLESESAQADRYQLTKNLSSVELIDIEKVNLYPIGYVCQPVTDTYMIVYSGHQMAPLVKANGFVFTCGEVAELTKDRS